MNKINNIIVIAITVLALQSCSSLHDITSKDVAMGAAIVGGAAVLVGACDWVDRQGGFREYHRPHDPSADPYRSVFRSNEDTSCLGFFLGNQ